MKKALATLAILATGGVSSYASTNYNGGTLTENFDGMPTSGNTALSATIGTQNALPGTFFEGVKAAGTGATFSLIADDGTSNAGGLHDYGTAAATDRALGGLASAGAIGAWGAEFVNNTGATITSVTLSLTREQWRSATGTAGTMAFAFGLSGGTATSSNYLTDTSLTANTTFDLVGDAPVAAGNGALDGNVDSIPVSGTITGLSWAAGQSLFIRWTDTNDTGNDSGIALDNFSLAAGGAAVPEPATWMLMGIGLLVGAQRFRRKA